MFNQSHTIDSIYSKDRVFKPQRNLKYQPGRLKKANLLFQQKRYFLMKTIPQVKQVKLVHQSQEPVTGIQEQKEQLEKELT